MTCSIMASTAAAILTATGVAPVLATTAPTSDFGIIEADGHRSIQPVRPEKKPAAKLPMAIQLGFDFIPTPLFSLAPMDTSSFMDENEQEVRSGAPLRYGAPRALEIYMNDGQWIDVPGGRLWQIEVQTQGAENARIKLEQMNLPKGAELRMYSPDNPANIAGPFTGDGPFDTGEAWSKTSTTDSVVIEYFEHIRTKFQEGLPFVITEITHGFLPILKGGGVQGGLASGAGSCHNHPACFSAWADIADSAAVVLFSGGYLCSGQLMATTSGDETPYYTTANHCISSQGSANSSEFYFFYERTTCTGSYSSGTSVSGADLVATYSSSDNTLLMIRGGLPNGVFWAGWTTADPPTGTDITSVHFPQGDYMRISFGDTVSSGICGSSSNWVGTTWNDGVTEVGSSGSGVYRDSDQKLFGVLTCGDSSCSNQNGTDGYGRFSRAYSAAFSSYMPAGSDDGYEPNGTCSSATSMGDGTYSNLVVKSVDEDHYSLMVPAGNTINLTVDFTNSHGDIDAQLLSACGGTVLDSGGSHSNDETLSWTNSTLSDTTVILRTYLYSDTRANYNLYVSGTSGGGGDPTGACCNGSDCSLQTAANCASAGGTYQGDGTSCSEVTCGGGGGGDCDVDWTADCVGTCFPDYVYEAWQGDGYCDDGTYIPSEWGCDECPPGVPIYMDCKEFDCDNGDCPDCEGGGGGGTGACCVGKSCTVVSSADCNAQGGVYNGDGSTCAEANCDGGGGGGGCDDATAVGEGDFSFSTTGSTTNVDLDPYCDLGAFGDEVIYSAIFFAYTASESGTATVSTCNQADFDTRLSAHAGDCEPSSVITCLDDTDGCSGFTTTITFDVVSGTTYYIIVGGYSDGDAGSGLLSISVGGGGGGGECPAGEIPDCNGNCAPDYWVGDGYCDDGTYEWNGNAIYFNCDEFNCDAGDCTDCGGGGGECPTGEIPDCNGNCAPDYWVGDGYCDDGTYEWNGNPIYFNCDEFSCDAGDCTDCGGGGGGECEPTIVTVGDNEVDTTASVGVTLDLTGYCDPGEFGTDAFLNTAFYQFTAPESAVFTVSTCNQAAWDTRLSAHNDDCAPENVIVCLDDTEECDLFTTTIEFSASSGSVYVIALGGYSAEDYGPATLTISGGGGGTPTGACCQETNCSVMTSAECSAMFGKYLGDGTTCESGVTCNPTGACCLSGPAGKCEVTTQLLCEVDRGTFYEGQECTPDLCGPDDCLGDLNGDSIINGADLTILLGAWGGTGGDLNGDGVTDGADLTIILGSWGPC